jgi:uncharacterized membrane protein YphA (DoxX/SURF4 family)
MDDSMAHPSGVTRTLDLPAWKAVLSHLCALGLAVLFVVSGVWKIVDPFTWRTMVEQLLVPYAISMPLTLALGIIETFSGVLILVPRFRRWGAWLIIVMLVVFMVYMGINYSTLKGKDCSCFPWLERTVSTEFFVGDAIMLLMAGIALVWSRPSQSRRSAAVVLGAISVFAAVSYGVNAARQSGIEAPPAIVVNGEETSLRQGRAFLYFYDPQCSHCEMAAKEMGTYDWGDTRVIAIPTASPQWAEAFLRDTGFKQAGTSLEAQRLREIFAFGDPPYGVALQDGRMKGGISRFEGDEPAATLRKYGLIR